VPHDVLAGIGKRWLRKLDGRALAGLNFLHAP
jgi:hypothetical protein